MLKSVALSHRAKCLFFLPGEVSTRCSKLINNENSFVDWEITELISIAKQVHRAIRKSERSQSQDMKPLMALWPGPSMLFEQECIPVGYIPPASVATTRSQYLSLSIWRQTPTLEADPPERTWDQTGSDIMPRWKEHGTRAGIDWHTPLQDRQTGVKWLPSRNFVGRR